MPIEEAPGGKFSGSIERGEMYAGIQQQALSVVDAMTDLLVPTRGEMKERIFKAVEHSLDIGGINSLHTDIINAVGNEEFSRRLKEVLQM